MDDIESNVRMVLLYRISFSMPKAEFLYVTCPMGFCCGAESLNNNAAVTIIAANTDFIMALKLVVFLLKVAKKRPTK
ncbi:hypothetical protein ACLI08_02640 [Flavobacterium sp. RNTU_13]|uniref:hypothetical protein n=1 Tax=Flavobacterium sp. RNTU_13 TaxID=3375145 RepID=UPI003985B259